MNTISFGIGIDIGGTFTDFAIHDPAQQSLRTFNLPSTPHDDALAVMEGLRTILTPGTASRFIHGSTVAGNALLERKGDVLSIRTPGGGGYGKRTSSDE